MDKKKKRLLWQVPFLLFLIVGTVVIIRNQRSTPYQHNQGLIFGTTYSVTYQYEADLQQELEAELRKVDAEFSMFNPHSSVSLFNKEHRLAMSATFSEVYELARKVNESTHGAFDITVAPLVNAWGFGFKNQQMPADTTVKRLLKSVGMSHLMTRKTDGKDILTTTDKGVMLDFSAIAKGFGSDVLARYLDRKGVKNYMIEIGGEVVTSGISDKRVPWRIGVVKPSEDSLSTEGELQTVLNVTDIAMATSGNYRNFYYKGGKRYAHTIDPATGYPVQHSILSATVLSKTCAEADAYATAFMVMGMEGARKVLSEHPELMAYLIYTDGKDNLKVWFSPSLKDKIVE